MKMLTKVMDQLLKSEDVIAYATSPGGFADCRLTKINGKTYNIELRFGHTEGAHLEQYKVDKQTFQIIDENGSEI